MLYHVKTKASDDGSVELKKMQLSSYPQCALFEQTILSREDAHGSKEVLVKWHAPAPAAGQKGAEEELEREQAESAKLKRLEAKTITVELDPPPRIEELECVEVDLHGSPTTCYKVGEEYDRWFSERSRRQSGQSTPQLQQQPQQSGGVGGGWLSTLTSIVSWFPTVPISVPGFIAIQGEREEEEGQEQQQPNKPWITFTDVAPLLITSESSLSNLSARLVPESPKESTESTTHPQHKVPMYKMRPNLVVDDQGEEAWAEDYWGELVVTSTSTSRSSTRSTSNTCTAPTTTNKKAKKRKTKLHLTGNCARCTSLNVDYDTGKPAKGEMGTVLKKLMKDRRSVYVVEEEREDHEEEKEEEEREVWISVGDEVQVTRRNEERTVMDWPF
ncbi:hypothetical protein NEUTE2DRAFT_97857 [Neurospora tetrasperma FGSC 2509]|nr:hypothetical protein NEUTE2DRAFT_97857 [Neurospora tetrasperma FGSC 2509]